MHTVAELKAWEHKCAGAAMKLISRRLWLTNPFARELAGEPPVPERISDIIGRTFTATQTEQEELDAWIEAEDARYQAKGI